MKKDLIKNDRKIALTIALKYNQLKREYLDNLKVEEVVSLIFSHKWKHRTPESISEAVIEIMQIKADEVVAFLSQKAKIEGYNNNLDEYQDLFSKGAQ